MSDSNVNSVERPKVIALLLTIRCPRNARLFVVCLSLLAIGIIWFGTGIMIGSDTNIPFDSINYLERQTGIWDFVISGEDVRHLSLWTWGVLTSSILFTFESLQFSLPLSVQLMEFILFVVTAFAGSYGIGKLIELLADMKGIAVRDEWVWQVFIGAISLTYVFSTWSINMIWRAFWPYMFHLAFLPLLLYAFLKFVSTERGSLRYLALGGLISLAILPAYSVPVSLVFDVLLMLILAFSFSPRVRKNPINTIIKLAIFLIPVGLLLLPFILPALFSSGATSSTIERIVTQSEIDQLLLFNSPDIARSLVATGYPPYYSSSVGESWYLNMPLFWEPLHIAAFLLLVFLPLVLRKQVRFDRSMIPMILFFIGAVIMTSSIKSPPPFSEFLDFLFQFKAMQLLRSTFARFGEYVLLSAILIMALLWAPILVRRVGCRIRGWRGIVAKENRIRLIAPVLAIIICVPIVSSALTIQAWQDTYFDEQPIHTNMPSGYVELCEVLSEMSSDLNKDMILIPTPNDLDALEWKTGPSILRFGSYSRTMDPSSHFFTYQNMISRMLNGEDVRLYSNSTIIMVEDAVLKTQDEMTLNNSLNKIISDGQYSEAMTTIPLGVGEDDIYLINISNDGATRFVCEDGPVNDSKIVQEVVGIMDGDHCFSYSNDDNIVTDMLKQGFDTINLSQDSLVDLDDIWVGNDTSAYSHPLSIEIHDGDENANSLLFNLVIEFSKINSSMVVSFGEESMGDNQTLSIPLEDIENEFNISFTFSEVCYLEVERISCTSRLYLSNVTMAWIRAELIEAMNDPSINEECRLMTSNSDGIDISDMGFVYSRNSTCVEDLFIGGALSDGNFLTGYERKASSEWEITLEDYEGGTIVFCESYDPGWTVEVIVDGMTVERIGSEEAYCSANGFNLESRGDMVLIVKYEPQEIVNLGFISGISLFCVFMMITVLLPKIMPVLSIDRFRFKWKRKE